MKKLNSLQGLIISYLIAPIVYFVLTAAVAAIIFQLIANNHEDRFPILPVIQRPLTAILAGELQEAESYPGFAGFLAVFDFDGTIYLDNLGILNFSDSQTQTQTSQFQKNQIPLDAIFFEDANLSGVILRRFQEHEIDGIIIFDPNYLPLYLQNTIVYFFIFFILLLSTGASFLGHRTLKSLNSSISQLILAADQVAHGNLHPTLDKPQFRELESLVVAFTRMTQQIKQTSELEQRFTLAISHDLKTPLTSIRGYLEAIRDNIIVDPEEIHTVTHMILQKSALLEERIQESIDFAASRNTTSDALPPPSIDTHGISSGLLSGELSFGELCPQELLDALSLMFKDDAQIRKRRFQSNIEFPSEIKILGNSNLLQRALENIFDNACRYTSENDTIQFTAKIMDSQLIIAFEDTGPGVHPDDQPHIFELYYRSDKGRNQRGMGIGLAMVQQVVNNAGGIVEYFSSPLGGAGFRLMFNILPPLSQ